MEGKSAYVDDLLRQVVDLESEVKRLRGELSFVDEALARRPALDHCGNRYDKIVLACRTAKRADELAQTLKSLFTASRAVVDYYRTIPTTCIPDPLHPWLAHLDQLTQWGDPHV